MKSWLSLLLLVNWIISLASELDNTPTAEMFKGKYLKALIIGCGLVLFHQITGQPSVLCYTASVLQNAGFSTASDAMRVSVLLGLFKLVITGTAVTVDELGRRPLLLGGVSGWYLLPHSYVCISIYI